VLYVSNFFRGGREFVSRIGTDGAVRDLEWVGGLNRPTGLCLVGDLLYAVERNALAEIDVETGKIRKRYSIVPAMFPNDVAADGEGNLFVSASQANAILRLVEGSFETWLRSDEIAQPNGMSVVGEELLVGCSGDGSLRAVNLEDRSIRTVTSFGEAFPVDGVHSDGEGNVFVSDYTGRLFLVSPDGEARTILDVSASSGRCADLEYVPGKRLLVIPGLEANTLVGYRWAPGD
jgi:hypothetical protein